MHVKITGKHPIDHARNEEHKKFQRIDKVTWHTLEESFGLTSPESPNFIGEPLCERPEFELFIGIMVMLNAIVMALELDYSSKHAVLEDKIGWTVADLMFCTFFAAEILVRVWCLGMYDFFKQPRYLADVILVAFNIADSTVQLSGAESTGLQSFSALRILRLFKIMKLLRLVSHVKELSLIATGLVSALKSLQWVSLLLGVVIFVMAVMFKILMGRECDADDIQVAFAYRFPDVDPIVKCEEFWGSVPRSMYTLYQITTLESWSEVLVRPIFDARPVYIVVILAFQLVTTFGLLNIVVAAIVDGTMNSIDEAVVENQNRKHTAAHLKVLRDIFLSATKGDEREVTKDSMEVVLLKNETRRKLLLLNIEYDDPSQIWRIVDVDNNGSVGIKDFTINLMRMRGAAKAKDLLAIRSQIYRVTKAIETKVDQVKAMMEGGATGSAASAPLPEKTLPSPAEIPGDAMLKNFQVELRGEMGKMSEQLQELGKQLTKDISLRLGTVESNILQITSSFQQPSLSPVAAELYVQPAPIPREQGLPSLPSYPCCGVARAAPILPAVPVAAPPLIPSVQAVSDDRPVGKLAVLLKGDHQALIRDLQQKHTLLLSRLNNGLPREAQDEIMARLSEEPVAKASEPKALAFTQSCVSTQTNADDEILAAPVPAMTLSQLESGTTGAANAGEANGDGDKPGSLVEDEQAQKLMSDLGMKDKGGVAGGFANSLEEQKKAEAAKTSRMEKFVHGAWFEGFFAALIVANALIMACEVQYTGMDVGFHLKYPNENASAKDTWPAAREAFDALEMIFGVVFVFELVFKIGVLRLKFVHSTWNWLDTVIVGGWLVDTVFGVSAVLNPMMLRLFRLVKLLRVAKLFKSFQAFDSLSILIGSMKASGSVLFWSMVVLFTAQLAAALLLSQGLEGYMSEENQIGNALMQRQEVYKYFGSFTRSFVTTMQLTLGNWVPVCRLLYENVSGAWSFFIILYVIFIQFGSIKVISAVFIVETQKVASTDQELLILQKERQITRLIKNFAGVFKEIDSTGDGLVDWEEFQHVIHDHRVLTWLAALDFDIEQCEGIFLLLNGGDGKISFQEFVKGVQRLKGEAKSIDLTLLMARQTELAALVAKIAKRLSVTP